MTTTPRPPLPGPNNGLPPGEDACWHDVPREYCEDCQKLVPLGDGLTIEKLASIGPREMRAKKCGKCNELFCVCYIRDELAPLGDRHIGGLIEAPQAPYDAGECDHEESERAREAASMTYTDWQRAIAQAHAIEDALRIAAAITGAGAIAQPATACTEVPQASGPTPRRAAWNALDHMHQRSIIDAVGELLIEFRYGASISAEVQRDRLMAAVLDS